MWPALVAAGGVVLLGAASVVEAVFVGLWLVPAPSVSLAVAWPPSGLLPLASGTSSAVPLAAQGMLVGGILGAGAVLAALYGAGHEPVEATWWSWWMVLVYALGPVLVMPDAPHAAARAVIGALCRSRWRRVGHDGVGLHRPACMPVARPVSLRA